jgi:hypothetical protein
MDALMALTAGVAAKVYDDGVDMSLISNEYYKKGLETLQCFLIGGISINNFTFSAVNLVLNYLHHITNKDAFALPYEYSLLVVYPLFLILSFSKREYLTKADILVFVCLGLIMFFEPLFITEDRSPRKFVYRLGVGSLLLLITQLGLNLSSGIVMTLLYGAGYMLTSAMYQGSYLIDMELETFFTEVLEGTLRGLDTFLNLFVFTPKQWLFDE